MAIWELIVVIGGFPLLFTELVLMKPVRYVRSEEESVSSFHTHLDDLFGWAEDSDLSDDIPNENQPLIVALPDPPVQPAPEPSPVQPSPVKSPPYAVNLLPAWIRLLHVTYFSKNPVPLPTAATNVDPEPLPMPDSDPLSFLTADTQPSLATDNESTSSSFIEPSVLDSQGFI